MFAAMDPIKIALILLGLACTSFLYGTKILLNGLRGLRDKSYPLSSTTQLEGFWACLAATVVSLFGLITIGCGVATTVFGYFRLRQLF